MSDRTRTAIRIAAVGALAFLLTGCLKMDIHLTLSSDNTVDGSMILAFDKQLLELTGQNAQDIIGSAAPVPSGTQGVSTKPYDDGKFVGQEYTFESVPLSQFNSEDPTALDIVREGGVFKVSGTLDLSTGTDTGGNPAVDQALQSAEVKIAITFPGEVTDTNGQVDGTTVTWSPKIGEKIDIQATGSATGSGGGSSTSSSAIVWLVVAVFILLAAAVAVLLLRRKREAAEPAEGGGGAGEGEPMDEAGVTAPVEPEAVPGQAAEPATPVARPETAKPGSAELEAPAPEELPPPPS